MDDSPGIFEALVTGAMEEELRGLASGLHSQRRPLQAAEAADRISMHVGREITRALSDVTESERVGTAVAVARALIQRLSDLVDHADLGELPSESADVLQAILGQKPDGSPRHIASPLIPLLDTTLLTNAPGEPRLGSQIVTEIESADSIEIVMAFIRRSGVSPMVAELERHCQAGKSLRILTTTYTGSTERAALDQLQKMGARVRISYDVSTTRLHAKAWTFHRRAGYSTAYVGSSNLTHSAQVTGLEWNVRVSQARNPTVIEKIDAVFESYWSGGEFVDYEPDEFDTEMERAGHHDYGPDVILSPIELRPELFQERLLELLALARQRGHHRNLLVAATGTGKTVMAAVDYARLRETMSRSRLLVVAHREELLNQSLATFRHALRDAAFGEKWVGGSKPTAFDHVFASVQSLHASVIGNLPPDHFDVVIVDEFHHAAAPSYQRLLNHVQPVELLGLTATPERSDGLSVLDYFDGRIAGELRLWDAIDQHRLTPFMYFGVHDGVDLTDIPWKRGQGYDVTALSDRYTSTDAWARLVLKQTLAHADNSATMRCLGFCVSVDHAKFMAHHFSAHGVSSVAVWGDSPEDERRQALRDLASGKIRVVFSVDLFNEGVDVPAVDTILMLRPTESPTLFLQQLGRGLRRSSGKAFCTVLDFVGTHRKEFRFDRKLQALLGGTRRDVESAVEQGFPYLPAGCHMELDAVASEIVISSLRQAIPSRWPAKVNELKSLLAAGADVPLATFLRESGLDVGDIYDGSRCWSDLRDAAGALTASPGAHEVQLRRAVERLLHVDDQERIVGFRKLLSGPSMPALDELSAREQRVARMLVASITDHVSHKDDTVQQGLDMLWQHPQVRAEMLELLDLLELEIDHVHRSLKAHPDVPLQVHARYSRREILAAFGVGDGAKTISWQAGVLDAKAENADLFAFTLDKSSGSFSPTTRYRDYAISRDLIHWETQSVTRAESPTGRRYRNHVAQGRSINLFTRLRADDRAFWFLGPATYVSHVGEKPMAITWRLEHSLPGDLFASFAAAVA